MRRTDTRKKMLPIGVEDFKTIRTSNYYYIDKTGMISELLGSLGAVNLFTRPRRFGKTLNMSMLEHFFSSETGKELFDGLAITKETALCEEYMGKYPVISLSLKSVNGRDFASTRDMMCYLIGNEALRFCFLLDSGRLSDEEKDNYRQLIRADDSGQGSFSMSEAVLTGSLRTLSRLLSRHYSSQVILLIDEYDVPLAKAFERGYYEEMIILIRNLFEQALKTNPYLKFAVLTGCMRISKESIFTGLNNLKVLSVSDVRFHDHFGFTDEEVRELLDYYGLLDHYDTIKNWYDGYQFGKKEVYCPWDVINYCDLLCADPTAWPQNYWANTSSNDAVRRFIREAATAQMKREAEALVAGEVIRKEIREELTYRDMYNSVDNIWSLLYATGYLTMRGNPEGAVFPLAIPNLEIRSIFTTQIMELFRENVKKDGESMEGLCQALLRGDAADVQRRFAEYLKKTISIRDTFARRDLKENFYHGMLLGILGFKEDWYIQSNRETGDGFSDIVVEAEDDGTGIIIEVKYAADGDLEKYCIKALEQIEKNHYEEVLQKEGMTKILKYGAACYKKRCRIMLASEN